MNIYKIIVLIIAILLNACTNKDCRTSILKISNREQAIHDLDTTYLSIPLIKPLSNYIKNHDTVRCTWKMPPICLITFSLHGRDTIIYISGHKNVPDILENAGLKYKGGFFIHDIPVIVYDSINELGKPFYNENCLTDIVEIAGKGRDKNLYEIKTLPIWIYKVMGKQNIQLIRKADGVILK